MSIRSGTVASKASEEGVQPDKQGVKRNKEQGGDEAMREGAKEETSEQTRLGPSFALAWGQTARLGMLKGNTSYVARKT